MSFPWGTLATQNTSHTTSNPTPNPLPYPIQNQPVHSGTPTHFEPRYRRSADFMATNPPTNVVLPTTLPPLLTAAVPIVPPRNGGGYAIVESMQSPVDPVGWNQDPVGVLSSAVGGGSDTTESVNRVYDGVETPTFTPWVEESEEPAVREECRMTSLYEAELHGYIPRYPSLDSLTAGIPAIPDEVWNLLYVKPPSASGVVPSDDIRDAHPNWTPYRPLPLQLAHPHPRDARITFFEEPHVYYLDGSCAHNISVTTFLKAFFSPFDAVGIARGIMNSKAYRTTRHRPSYKWHDCQSEDDFIQKFNTARDLGTTTHRTLEHYLNFKTLPTEEQDPRVTIHVNQFFRWYNNQAFRTWVDYRTEWIIFDEELRLCGSIDYVGMDPKTGSLILFDFKCTANISLCSFGRLRGAPVRARGCLQNYDDCDGTKYFLQLNIYKYILQKNYGFHVKDMFLVQMHYSLKRSDVALLPVPDMTAEILQMLACRKVALLSHRVSQGLSPS
jgi:hypothetical protein